MVEVHVIDLACDDREIATVLDTVCRDIGFFQIVGHGVDEEISADAWRAFQEFFDLPDEEKMRLRPPSPGYPYGYIPVKAESLANSLGGKAPGDLKESFNVGPVDRPAHQITDPDELRLYSANLWPESLPALQPAAAAYYREMLRLAVRLMRLFSLALDLDPYFFDDKIDRAPCALRAINYPQTSEPLEQGQLRAGAHTDYGPLTILRQDEVGGLQVLGHDDDWVSVPSIDGALVINIGDLMARWTNDRWRSTLHRVVHPLGDTGAAARRQSMPFFFNANFDAEVACLPSCLDHDGTAKYSAVRAGPHLLHKFERSLSIT
ncbi:MAG: 2-oxoglutarate and iron-dependent oxygenase domain-containing protein [Gordonia sp. (in: high G+C Gram-positive bacteria)]